MILDIHVHCGLTRYPTRGGNPRTPESHYQADESEILARLDELGIDRAVLMSSGEQEEASSMHNFNADCRELVCRHPDRFAWMCALDPHSPDTVYQRLAHCKAEGAVGVGEIMVNEWLDSPFLSALFAAAQDLCLPVLTHMSTAPGVSYGVCDRPGLPLTEAVLQRYPKLCYIGHSQVFWMEISGDCPHDDAARSGFGHGPVVPGGRVPALLRKYPNLYADLSAFSGSCAIVRDTAFGVRFCEEFQDKLLFGTDTVNRYGTLPLQAFLTEQLRQGALSQAAYEKIMFRNAQRLLGVFPA